MSREIIRPEYNQPVIFRLGNAPTLVEGIRGPQWRFFVNDDQAMLYLDEAAKAAIDKLQPHNGAEICLRKERVGRQTHWAADIVENEPGRFMLAWEEATQARYEERRTASREAMPEWVQQPEPPPTPPNRVGKPIIGDHMKLTKDENGKVVQVKVNGDPRANGNGHHGPPPRDPRAEGKANAQAWPDLALARPASRILAGALCSAIDAAKAATEYAANKGMALKFSTDDVRAMGITLYIEASKK